MMRWAVVAIVASALLAPVAAFSESMHVRVPRANIRSAPSDSAEIIGKLDTGAIVEGLDRRGQWLMARGASLPTAREAWIHSSLLGAEAPKTDATRQREAAEVGPETALLVAEPKDGARPLAVFHRGTMVLIAERRGEWTRVFGQGLPDGGIGTGYGLAWIKTTDLAPYGTALRESTRTQRPFSAPITAPEVMLPPAKRDFTIGQPRLRCDEALFNGGYDRCGLEFTVNVTSSRSEDFEAWVWCDAQPTTETGGRMSFPRRKTQSDSRVAYVSSGDGSAMFNMSINVSEIFDPVIRVRLTDLRCRTTD